MGRRLGRRRSGRGSREARAGPAPLLSLPAAVVAEGARAAILGVWAGARGGGGEGSFAERRQRQAERLPSHTRSHTAQDGRADGCFASGCGFFYPHLRSLPPTFPGRKRPQDRGVSADPGGSSLWGGGKYSLSRLRRTRERASAARRALGVCRRPPSGMSSARLAWLLSPLRTVFYEYLPPQ